MNRTREISFLLIASLSAGGCIHPIQLRIPVDDKVQNSSEIIPVIHSQRTLMSSTAQYAEFTAGFKNTFQADKNQEGFSRDFREVDKMTLHAATGEDWQIQCTIEVSASGIVKHLESIDDQRETCDYVQLGKTESFGKLEIEYVPSENWKTRGGYQGRFVEGEKVIVEFRSIQRDAGGRAIPATIGFDILINGQPVGAIQEFITKDPKIWMPKTISARERLAIALAAPPLLRFERPDKLRMRHLSLAQ